MTHFIRILIICLLVIPAGSGAQSLAEINWITEEHAPQNFSDNGMPSGISVDVLKGIWSKLGFYPAADTVRMYPWARGYLMLQTRKNTCLFAMSMTDHRKKQFKFVGPYMHNIIGIVAKKERHIQVSTFEELYAHPKLKTIGSIRDDIGRQLLVNRGYPQHKIHTVNKPYSLIKMLHTDRISALALGYDAAVWEMKSQGIDPSGYQIIFILQQVETGFGFHRDTDPKLLRSMQSALDELKREGRVAHILDQYRH